MHRAPLVPLRLRPSRLPIAIVAIALFATPRVGAASSITSSILIDAVGEHTGDVFGGSVAWVGDVNGDTGCDINDTALSGNPQNTWRQNRFLTSCGAATD